MAELSTHGLLGLTLREPARALGLAPLAQPGQPPTHGGRRGRGGRAALPIPGAGPRRRGRPPLDPYLTRAAGRRAVRARRRAGAREAAAAVLPRGPRLLARPGRLRRARAPGQAAVDIPVVASLNGVAAGDWLDVRRPARAGRGGRPGGGRLLPAHRPGAPRHGGGAAAGRPAARGQGARPHPGRGQAQPLLLQPGRAAHSWRGRGGRPRPLRAASTSRTSTCRPGRWHRTPR